ncbi:phosphatidate cytidylyltransferase [Colletotrichum tofieldiae]|uniref:dolichol kinase n=1 Tax=Colletotrichum tofieldiae TaxID=708197 RepID=A0A161VMF7_9PEZI|nr:phosphatidate cytidylyltransferase [Colletotrichum tofieldiae]GKT58544.1 phosphatidate cytidylyltransferase [Colletotrichum tofieldiae]GKT78039.1 phosphatidate cytidylyltransferase [Colletotrichum tofieldiae]
MPEHLDPNALFGHDTEENDEIRTLSRSPHPYHHLNTELPHPAHRVAYRPSNATPTPPRTSSADSSRTPSPFPSFAKDSSQGSDSGTEADDEHFLKGLPAPKVRLHKGLRGRNEVLSGASTPLFSPDQEEDALQRQKEKEDRKEARRFSNDRNYRRTKELIRRVSEFVIVGSLFAVVRSNATVKPIFSAWSQELRFPATLISSLMVLYPLRLIAWSIRHKTSLKKSAIAVPTVFDPAPILYPPSVTLLVSLLISPDNQAVILPNIVLSISSIPKYLIPTARAHEAINPFQWLLSCVPIWMSQQRTPASYARPAISPETAVLLYPLHQTLLVVLHYLTTTSLLTAELQLLSIALINVLLLAHSPQATILQALLWGGGVGVLVICGPVIQWGIALARVPRLRFRRVVTPSKKSSVFGFLSEGLSMRRFKHELLGSSLEESASDLGDSEDEIINGPFGKPMRVRTFGMADMPSQADRKLNGSSDGKSPEPLDGTTVGRRNTFPYALQRPRPQRSLTHTSAGRRKRTASTTVRSFFKLTEAQATMRKWTYASYVYICIVAIILAPVREYIGRYALKGNEPVGWALGYLFGELPWFRFKVVEANLERWICLPTRRDDGAKAACHLGWVQRIRLSDFGEANTRLLMSAYWLAIVIVGLTVVIRLDPKYEVDTRRKVFHFMMVGMFLPATYIDPVFAALALSLVLTIFLILDLLRASQLPPLSRPIASFLTPYVDGRDHKGPVVISHLFLLIGCAIPLWLSLATLPRTGSGYLAGWEVPTREVSMVAGVICVGLGDAAASLIGRRYGHRKWVWGGGKSLEGSVAFAAAVFLGLMAATTWLRVGGWPIAEEQQVAWPAAVRNAGFCASVASLTEAVLTGGNDNVIVPVVLWTCVKSVGV